MKKTIQLTFLMSILLFSTLITISALPPDYDIKLTYPLERQSSTVFIFTVIPIKDGYDPSQVASVDYVFFSWDDASGVHHEEIVDVTYWYLRDDYIHLHIEASSKPNPEKGSTNSVAIVYGTFYDGKVFISSGPGLAWGRGR